jgi:hypothetical protein
MKNILVYDINSNSLLHVKHYIIRKWVSLLVYDINSKGDSITNTKFGRRRNGEDQCKQADKQKKKERF